MLKITIKKPNLLIVNKNKLSKQINRPVSCIKNYKCYFTKHATHESNLLVISKQKMLVWLRWIKKFRKYLLHEQYDPATLH